MLQKCMHLEKLCSKFSVIIRKKNKPFKNQVEKFLILAHHFAKGISMMFLKQVVSILRVFKPGSHLS